MSDEQIQQFMALTNASVNVATDYINQFGDLGEALNAFYAAQQDEHDFTKEKETHYNPRTESLRESNSDESCFGRTLSGQKITGPRSTPTPSGLSKSGKTKSKFRSFADMIKGSEDDDEDPENRNTFAGGETSGLEITDPHANESNSNSIIRDLLEKARRGGQRADEEEEVETQSEKKEEHFIGKGYRLGSDLSTPAQVVANNTQLPQRPKKVTREITFWREGFQVGDGLLYRYDDPENSYYLNELNQGRAPLKLLNVEFGQEVDVTVYKKLEESYVPPKRNLSGFHGRGQRLGSPIPGDSESPEPVSLNKEATTEHETKTQDKQEQEQEQQELEKPKGDTNIQIRYASGKREVLRCDSNNTVRFIYDHVKSNTQDSRPFILSHAFPVKAIDAFDSTLKEQDLCNAVVVQRWV